MSALRQAVDDYLAVRRAVGYQLKQDGHLLPDFVEYVEGRGGCFVTTKLALEWATQPTGGSVCWWALRLRIVRHFAQHLRAIDPRTEIPRPDLLPYRRSRRTPYLYADEDVVRLMEAARRLRGSLRPFSYATLFGLLAATGMRVGEAIALNRPDVDFDKRRAVVHKGKFNKSRELPLHETTLAALRAYARRRDRVFPRCDTPSFFISQRRTRLLYSTVHRTFLKLLPEAGLAERQPPPRIHGLRHRFIIKTLLGWYRVDLDVEAELPKLSTYVGHVCPSNTYWYLSATLELLRLASDRLERTWGELP